VGTISDLIDSLKGIKGPFIEALSDLDLTVQEGEIFGILGPNGAGKTTLIKILCTLVLHDEGEAYVRGYDVKKEPGKVLTNLQAVLPGSRGFTWRLSGRQNLEFYSLLYGLDDDLAKERIDYLLELTGLLDRADDDYQRYSTGMQRKLLLCRGLLRDTPIILFDEPTTGLDPGSAAEFRSLITDRLVAEEGKTVLMSTHNLSEAQDMCDRIAIMDRGKITACDTPNQIRYEMVDENQFTIALHKTEFTGKHELMLDQLQAIPGIKGVTPNIDPAEGLLGLTFRVDKNMDLSNILEVLLGNDLKIKAMNTREPSLEDAFIAITGNRPASSRRRFRH